DVPRKLERVDRRIASHESDHCALDRRRQLAALDYIEIDPGSRKASATRDYQMGNTVMIGAEREFCDGRGRQLWSLPFEQSHARRGVRKLSSYIEGVGV